MYYKADSVSHHVAVERADLSRFTPLLHVDDNKSLSDAVLAKQSRSEVLGGQVTRIAGKREMTCGGNISVSSTFSTTTSHPSNAIFRLYFPSCIPASTSRGEGAVVLNNDLRWPSWCANIFSLFLSCTLRAYTSMKRRTYDPAPLQLTPHSPFATYT